MSMKEREGMHLRRMLNYELVSNAMYLHVKMYMYKSRFLQKEVRIKTPAKNGICH